MMEFNKQMIGFSQIWCDCNFKNFNVQLSVFSQFRQWQPGKRPQQRNYPKVSNSNSTDFTKQPQPRHQVCPLFTHSLWISQDHSVNDQSRYTQNRKSYRAAASRKDTRKQERLARKQNKAVYFSSSHTSNTRKRGAEEELVESPQLKKLKPHGSNTTTPNRADASPPIKVSKESMIATKGSASEAILKLTRQLKGLLNR